MSGSSSGSLPGGSSSETAPLVVAGVLVAIALIVWSTGELAGLVGTGRWPAVPAGAVPEILVRLPVDAGHLRRAWPAAARPALPAEAGMVLSGLLVLAGCAGLAVGGVALRRLASGWAPASVGGVGRSSRGARWASGRDLSRLAVNSGDRSGRVVLGRLGRRLVATEARHSVLVLGPTQSGKSTSLAIPALLEWAGPVVATSVKDDLVAATLAWRSAQGRCHVFDPTAASARPGATWTPLAEASTWTGAQRMASWLVDAAPARSGMTDGGFWFAAAAKLLGPLLYAAAIGGRTMADVMHWTDGDDLEEAIAILDGAGEAEAAVALSAGASRDPRLRSSVTTTLETVLAPFEDPAVRRATSSCDIDPRTLLTGPHTLYLCGPSHEQARVQGLFASLISSVLATAMELAHDTGHPLDPPLLLVLDEAANIAPLRDLDTLASTAAGLGIHLVTICQDLAQLAGRYGAERSRTIANNHRAKLVLSGVADLGTLDLVSGLAGEAAVTEETVTQDLRDGRRSRTRAVAYRRLAPTDELRRTEPGHGVLVYGHLPAARIALRPWYEDRELRRRVADPPPASASGDATR